MADLGRCLKMVPGKGPWAWQNAHQCGNKAIVSREGKNYCRIHDPEYIKAKQAEREAKWDAESKDKQERWDRERLILGLFTDVPTETIKAKSAAIKEIVWK